VERNLSRQTMTSCTAASKVVKNQLLGDFISMAARLLPFLLAVQVCSLNVAIGSSH
jgi:hypothetical protein